MSETKEQSLNFHYSTGRHITVLSTKKLSVNQKELILNQGLGLVERNFISIVPLPFEINKIPSNIIITSKNAVRAILNHPLKMEMQQKKIFCVGEKTAAFLKENRFNVCNTRNYGSELASEIIKKYRSEEFLFICGKQKNDELPGRLKEAGVTFDEIIVYETRPNPQKIIRTFEGVLFFSPSAVESYCSENDLLGSVAFCIGKTTAAEAEKFTSDIVTASTPSIENVIVQVVKYFKL